LAKRGESPQKRQQQRGGRRLQLHLHYNVKANTERDANYLSLGWI
jgi:hypothetical protein